MTAAPALQTELDAYLHWYFEQHPVHADALGAAGYSGRLGDFTAGAYEGRERESARWLSRLEALDDPALSTQTRLDRELVIATLRGQLLLVGWPAWRRDPSVYLGPVFAGLYLPFLHRLTPEDERVEAVAARLGEVPEVLQACRDNLDPGLAAPLLVRPHRRRLVLLAAAMPAGVVVQAVVGGITVRTGLAWWTVALHFLISMVLVWLAVLLVAAFGEGDGPPVWLIPRPLQALLATATAVLAALLAAGTMVTAAGPHAGDAYTPRLDVNIPILVQLHADLLIGFLGLLIGLGFALRAVGAPARTARRYRLLVGVVLAQGSLGVVQYATGVPEVLVSLHVLGAALVVVAMAGLWAGCRDRHAGPRPSAGSRLDTPAGVPPQPAGRRVPERAAP